MNDGELSTKKSRKDESEKEIEDSENVLPLIENTVKDGNVIEDHHISVDDIVNNASSDALEKDHVDHNVVVINSNKESYLRFNLPLVMKK